MTIAFLNCQVKCQLPTAAGIQNNAARIVLEASRRSIASPLLKTLHWLPVQQRIDYKVALLTFKVRSTLTPSYLRLLIQDRQHVHNMRQTTTALCQLFTTTTFAKRAFRCSAPAVWNSLPKTVLSSDSVAVFMSRLKTSFLRLSLLPLLTNTLPGPSAPEVTTLWCYTNLSTMNVYM